jgi:hypothetical protein
LTWTGQAEGVVYDIESATMSDLRAGGASTAACLVNDVAGSSYDDDRPIPAGDGLYYVIRAQSACGSGIYGDGSPWPSPSRDAAIATSPSDCP